MYGYSMGALQAYEWAVAYPEATPRIACVCGAARCGELNSVFLMSLEAALTSDPAYDPITGGFSTKPVKGLETFAKIYAGWGVGEGWYTQAGYKSAHYSSGAEFVEQSYVPGFAGADASNLLAQLRTWRSADVGLHMDGGFEKAISRIKCEVLLMPSTSDKYFTVSEARVEADLLGARCVFKPIESTAGHRAGDPHRHELARELAYLQETVQQFMQRPSRLRARM